ncbi:MAG: TetR/AcrR family transcriptional regulator [Methanomicrobiaceae archaeon]|nr:TetR/AcrR family transcriptional regulator [Methanomicrobiaceae archaeon]
MEKKEMTDKRKAILKSALLLFTERGFHGTPTSLIAREAGVATGTLFHYFGTKENLISDLYLEIKREAGKVMSEGTDTGDDTTSGLRRIASNYVSWGIRNPAKIKFMEQFCLSPFVPDETREEGVSNFLFLAGLFEKGITSGEIKPLPVELAIKMAAEFLNGVISYIIRQGPCCDANEIFELAYPVLEDGLRKR